MSPKARLFSSNLAETGVKLRDAATSDLDERTETLERRGQRRKDEKAAAVSRARKKERKRRKLWEERETRIRSH